MRMVRRMLGAGFVETELLPATCNAETRLERNSHTVQHFASSAAMSPLSE